MVKTHQLLAFDAVVRLGSFAHAAQALHVTPAALSSAVKELEERVGFQLLERTTRSLRLTEAGRGYLSFVGRALSELADAERYAQEVKQGFGVIRIATTHTVIATLIAPALPQVHRRWPNLRITLVDILAERIGDALTSRQADLAIGVRLTNDEQFESHDFFKSRWSAYFARNHPLAGKKQVRWSDLGDSLLFMSTLSTMYLQKVLGRHALKNVQGAATASFGMAMASANLGVAVFPGYARPLAKFGGLRAAPIQAPVIDHQLEIGVARVPSTPAPMRAIMEMLIEEASGANAALR